MPDPTRPVLTTADVARVAHVSHRTVCKWFATGLLKGYRIPGSRARRFVRADVAAFLREHGMPLGELAGDAEGVTT